MAHATFVFLYLARLVDLKNQVDRELDELLGTFRETMGRDVLDFLGKEINPATTHAFETELSERLRELGRQITERVYNMPEGDNPERMPHDVVYQSNGFRRLNEKTPNRHVATLFGTITLWRHAYRPWERDSGEGCIFPLELQLGLVQGATPALAEAAARYMAEAGATQQAVLSRLRDEHNVRWGAPRLREVIFQVAEAMAPSRQEHQVRRLLELLEEAQQSKGRCKPVVSVGRDGVTLREYQHRYFEHASVATVTVYDRRGQRLDTVYLAFTPEPHQVEMSRQLTALIEELLRRWEGPLPRLCYVTDAGSNETTYYRQLRRLRHPRTGEKLTWQRIIDFYHTSERIWSMAAALFGKQEQAKHAWARRMLKLLKKPNGPFRVLHSAAALYASRDLSKERDKEFHKAYNYIRIRTRYMQYAEYKRVHLPLGSGVTEAACKTIVEARMKLSGQRWKKSSAQPILDLRTVLLSGIWHSAYQAVLSTYQQIQPRVYSPSPSETLENAA